MSSEDQFDLIIRSGEVIDGSGAPRFRADVAISGDRIAQVGDLSGVPAARSLEAAGRVVTPGFIDMHSHADFVLPILPTADSLVHQGITTVVVGQCGMSTAPLLPATRDAFIASQETEYGPLPWNEWTTLRSYLEFLQAIGPALNVVPLVGLGTIRAAVMGFSAGAPDRSELGRMQHEVLDAMDQGAIGVSSGLIYPPGCYASTAELVELVRPAGARGGYYFSHIRSEEEHLLEALSEAIHIGRETGAPVQISHLKAAGTANWHLADRALALIDQARDEGLDVCADMYPYPAGNTVLSVLLPDWAHEGGKAATLARLKDPETRQRIIADLASWVEWDAIQISETPRQRHYEGRAIAELAAAAAKLPEDWLCDALVETGLDASIILFSMSEDNLARQIRHPHVLIGTDASGRSVEGPLSSGVPHPRNYGSFARVLGHFVRERHVLSLEEAIWKMSGRAAQRLNWTDRGLLRVGYQADLVILDPARVADRATFQAPHQYPAGIETVLVNGVAVIDNEKHTRARPGRVLRSA